MNPPLRTEADRSALLDALRDGTISAIATDHAPHSREEKEVPFEAAPFGVIGLETAFSALYTNLVLPGLLTLETLLDRLSAGPAAIFGLAVPRIAVGARANLTLIDTEARLDRAAPAVQIALDQLLAHRRAARKPDPADDRRRPDGVRAMTRLPDPRRRNGVCRRVGRRARARVRRGGLHDRDDRLPGDGDRSELRRADRLLHRADGRQLRRRRQSARSRAASTRPRS